MNIIVFIVTTLLLVLTPQSHASTQDRINLVEDKRTEEHHRVSNTSRAVSHRKKRLFAPLPEGAAFILTPKFTMPIPGLAPGGSELHVEVPLSFNLPTMASEATASRHTDDTNADSYSYYRRLADDKMHLYNYAEGLISRFGLDGRQCMLRTVCEIAEAPVENAGVLGEMINTVLRSSLQSSDQPKSRDMLEYTKAERLGKQYGHCQYYYAACPLSFFNLV